MDRSNFITSFGGHDDEPHLLIEVDGVTLDHLLPLGRAGIRSVDDVRQASQSELAEIDGISNSLAAKMKADVGGMTVDQKPGVHEPPIVRPIRPPAPRVDEDHGMLGSGPYDRSKRDDPEPDSDDGFDEEIDAFIEQLERVLSEELDETDREILRVLTEHLLENVDDAE